MKFGGTSVGSAQRMKGVASLINDGEDKIVVLSAMSGTTNSLVEICGYLANNNPEGANEVINKLESLYKKHINELYSTDEYKFQTLALVKEVFNYLRSFTKQLFTSVEERIILAQGEIISTNMVTNYLKEQGISAHLIAALDYMRTDKNGEPDATYIKEKLTDVLANSPKVQIYITQGFICRNING
jgi:aspartate kinase